MRCKAGLSYKPCMPRRAIRFLAWVLLAAGGAGCQAMADPGTIAVDQPGGVAVGGGEVIALVQADRWAEAERAAAAYADPVAVKLVRYFRLLAPGAASAEEIDGFIADNPQWPQQAAMATRRDAALAVEPDDTVVLGLCARGVAQSAAALLRCVQAERHAGRDATADASRAWIATPGDPLREAAMLAAIGPLLSGADQQIRFLRLAWTDTAGAARQASRLGAPDRLSASARLALRQDDPRAAMLLAALAGDPADPGFMLDRARWLRRSSQADAALALWREAGPAAELAAPAERRGAFWDERNLLARRRLREGDARGAYLLAAGYAPTTGEARLDSAFLAGFVALRRLHDPATARRHFSALQAASGSVITQGRAHYWLARAAPNEAAARAEYRKAAEFPGSYYGQLASRALGGDGPPPIDAGGPAAGPAEALEFAGGETVRAAAWLVAWGASRRARPFLLRLADPAASPQTAALDARLALGFDMPETAVAIARLAGRDGIALTRDGWPMAQRPPGTEPALALAVMRQESSFDPATTSPVGARGLMQLMPPTAAEVSRGLGQPAPTPASLLDPAVNMRLGTTYLHVLLGQFGGTVPLAVAAYNAGPARVAEWLAGNGDPRVLRPAEDVDPFPDMIDWIELIPFSETRNYVQRVMENQAIYAARLP